MNETEVAELIALETTHNSGIRSLKSWEIDGNKPYGKGRKTSPICLKYHELSVPLRRNTKRKEYGMARPIKETPILYGEEARKFEEDMKNVRPLSDEKIAEIKRDFHSILSIFEEGQSNGTDVRYN